MGRIGGRESLSTHMGASFIRMRASAGGAPAPRTACSAHDHESAGYLDSNIEHDIVAAAALRHAGEDAMKDGLRFVDCDMHIMEPVDLFDRYLDRRFKDRVI